MRDDRSICEHAGFCGNHATNVWKMIQPAIDDTIVRSQMMAMVARCPSGALTLQTIDGAEIEAELAEAIGVIDDGPLSSPVACRAARRRPAVRGASRVTLCRCGQSANKPLCDGTHATAGFSDH